jgi:hypothetical protein
MHTVQKKKSYLQNGKKSIFAEKPNLITKIKILKRKWKQFNPDYETRDPNN